MIELTEQKFCDLYNSFTGEGGIFSGLDYVSQLTCHKFTGEELLEFCQFIVKELQK